MKFLCVMSLAAMASCVYGKIKIPSYVHQIGALEAAQKEAEDEKLPLAFVYTDPGTT